MRWLTHVELTRREQALIMLVLATLLIGGIVQQCRHHSQTVVQESAALPVNDVSQAHEHSNHEEDRIQ